MTCTAPVPAHVRRLRSLAALGLLVLAAPACVFAGGRSAATRDVEKPTGDPRVPESRYLRVDVDGAGLSDVVYETPEDRVLVIGDLRLSVAGDVIAEVGGAPLTLFPSTGLRAEGSWFVFQSPAGLRLPAASKLRVRRTGGASGPDVIVVFLAGELVRA